MNITELPSPNFDSRDGQAVDMLVLHYTGMASATQALERLCDPAAKVSAHYVVDEDGTIYRLVAEESRAWHAGVSCWRGNTNINQRSIGIELVNPGHEFGYRGFPKAQMEAVAALCKDILARHAIPARNVVGHSDVAPERKEDPGELFDWKWLAGQGVGIWHRELVRPSNWLIDCLEVILNVTRFSAFGSFWGGGHVNISPSIRPDHIAVAPLAPYSQIQAQLAQYGYECPQSGLLDDATRKVIIAFQRHFFPERLTGVWDHACAIRLASLRALI